MDCPRAAAELGWRPTRSSAEALVELLDGMRAGAGAPTPPLVPDRVHMNDVRYEEEARDEEEAA